MSSDEKLITVIIPVYNVERFLSRCIDSVLSQSYKNLEILLIDDGSTDGSSEICDHYAERDYRIKVIHQKNQGIAAVRNVGVLKATGEYLFWLDSDDYVSEEIIYKLYNNLEKHHAEMSICNFAKGMESEYTFQSKKNAECIEFDAKYGQEMIYKDDHYAFIMAASWAKLIKKELYDGLKYPEGKLFEDIYMSHHLIQRCSKIVYTDEILYYYFQWPESILGKTLRIEKLDYLDAFEDRILFYEKMNDFKLVELARVQYLHALIWEYSRAKNILHNPKMVAKIKKAYRKYYRFGLKNTEIPNETVGYMFAFYISPELREFMDKIQSKVSRWI